MREKRRCGQRWEGMPCACWRCWRLRRWQWGARELLTVREAPPLYEGGTRRVLRVWLIETWMGSSEWVLSQAAAFEQANDGVHVRVRRALAQELTAADAVLPDVLLFEPGSDRCAGGAAHARGGGDGRAPGNRGGRPLPGRALRGAGVHGRLPGRFATTRCSRADGRRRTWRRQGSGRCRSRRTARAAIRRAALSMGAASQGLLGALPDGALAADALACTPEKAYRDFAQGRAAVLVCTQREARRMAALREAGEGFAFSALAPERAYTDLLLLGGVTRGAPQGALGSAFLSQLVDEPAQAQLAAHGLYPVDRGGQPVSAGDGAAAARGVRTAARRVAAVRKRVLVGGAGAAAVGARARGALARRRGAGGRGLLLGGFCMRTALA